MAVMDYEKVKKYCSGCKTSKSITLFNLNVSTGDGLQSYCKDCQRKRAHEYYLERKAAVVEMKKKISEKKAAEWRILDEMQEKQGEEKYMEWLEILQDKLYDN